MDIIFFIAGLVIGRILYPFVEPLLDKTVGKLLDRMFP